MRGLVRMNSEDSGRRLIGNQPSGSVPQGYVKRLDTAVARAAATIVQIRSLSSFLCQFEKSFEGM